MAAIDVESQAHGDQNKKRKFDHRDREDGKSEDQSQENDDPLATATTLYVGNLCVSLSLRRDSC
jgi:hypothetical protein